MNATTLSAVGAAVAAIIAAWLSYRASAQANRVSEKKVDAEAYERSQAFYERLLTNTDKESARLQQQVDRLREQLEHTNAQLAQEQDVSSMLRRHVKTLQEQVASLEATIASLRTQLGVPGPAQPPSGRAS